MSDDLTDREQDAIIERRRERWGAWPRLIEQAAQLDSMIEALVEREENQPYPDPDRLDRLWALHERVLARLGRRRRQGPPEWAWGLPGWEDETNQRPATAHGDGWRPVATLDDDERATLAALRATQPG